MASTPTKPAELPRRTGLHYSLYRVVLHNDDVNSMEHVVQSLERTFRFGRRRCVQIMLDAHQNGAAECVVEPFERAEFYRERLRSFSLIATIEPV